MFTEMGNTAEISDVTKNKIYTSPIKILRTVTNIIKVSIISKHCYLKEIFCEIRMANEVPIQLNKTLLILLIFSKPFYSLRCFIYSVP